MSREMKDSGVPWIGTMPVDWRLVPLKYCFTVENGSDPVTVEGDTPVYGSGSKSFKTCREFKNGPTVLLGRKGTVNIPQWVEGHYWNVDTAFNTIPKGNYSIKLLYYVACCFDYDNYSTQTALPSMTQSDYNNFRLPLMSKPEQQRIADFLDSKCSQIDEISKKIQEEIDTLEEYKKSVITEAVTKGLDPNAEMKDSGVEWIGKIPKNWSLNRVANTFSERNEPGEDGLPFLSVSINSGISDKELSEEETSRQFIRADAKKNKKVYPGDIVYNMMRAWQGAIGAVRTKGMVSAAYVTAKPIQTIDTRYFEYLLRTPTAIQEMNKYSYGIMDFRKRLYWPYFKNISLCVPPLDEQITIADYADEITQTTDSFISSKKKQLSVLEEYKKSLIYEYVTGKKEVAYG